MEHQLIHSLHSERPSRDKGAYLFGLVRRFQTEYICTTHTRFLDPWPHNQTADIGSSCPGNLAMEHQGRKVRNQKLIALHFVYPLTQNRNATIAGEGPQKLSFPRCLWPFGRGIFIVPQLLRDDKQWIFETYSRVLTNRHAQEAAYNY